MKEELKILCQSKSLELNSSQNGTFSEKLVNDINFTFNINQSATEWVKFYKEDWANGLENGFREDILAKNPMIFFDDYIVLRYFYTWVLVDFFEILPYLPSQISTILNIGAGIGYLDIILSKLYFSKNLKYYLIEKESSRDSTNFDGSTHNIKKNIKPLFLLKNNFEENKTTNAFFFSPEGFKKNINNITYPINLIISLRSYCYLYDIDEYYNELSVISDKNTLFIIDVHIDFTEKFKNKFIPLKQIGTYKTLTRVLARLR